MKRNCDLLLRYSKGLDEKHTLFLLKTTLFGGGSNINEESLREHLKVVVLEPHFLNARENTKSSEMARLCIQKKLHTKLVALLTEGRFDLIVVGVDSTGIGHWVASVAKSLGLKTLVCQEGCRFLYQMNSPQLYRLKQIFYQVAAFLLYRHAAFRNTFKEYQTAEFAALWGAYDKNCVLGNGKCAGRIFVIGAPKQGPEKQVDLPLKGLPILFLDISVSTFPKGTLDDDAFLRFNNTLVKNVEKAGYGLIYKPHPLAKQCELDMLKDQLSNHKNTVLATKGVAENYLSSVFCCITYPSTAIYGILASSLPLIMVKIKAKGFTKILLDPAQRYGAGLTVHSADEIIPALSKIEDSEWAANYQQASKRAAEEMVGPLDGKAMERFAVAVSEIVKKELHPHGPKKTSSQSA